LQVWRFCHPYFSSDYMKEKNNLYKIAMNECQYD